MGVVFLGAGCSSTPVQQVGINANPSVSTTIEKASAKVYSLDEVAKHATQTDCWTAIDGNVYDVTAAIPKHPGGAEAMAKGCGKDGSPIFKGIKDGAGHPERAKEGLENYLIGTLQ